MFGAISSLTIRKDKEREVRSLYRVSMTHYSSQIAQTTYLPMRRRLSKRRSELETWFKKIPISDVEIADLQIVNEFLQRDICSLLEQNKGREVFDEIDCGNLS